MPNERDPDVTASVGYLEDRYQAFLVDPTAVDLDLRHYFESLSGGARGAGVARSAGVALTTSAAACRSPMAAAGDLTEAAARKPFLQSLSIFRSLADDDVGEVASLAVEESYADRQYLVREGEMGNDLFVVVEGQVLIAKGGRAVTQMGPGDVVGELSVLDQEPRSADALAYGDVRVLRVGGADLLSRLDRPGFALGLLRGLTSRVRDKDTRQDRVDQLINAFRERGHLLAELNPLAPVRESHPELEPAHYGLENDLCDLFSTASMAEADVMTLEEILGLLRATYCGAIGAQFMHIDDGEPKRWLMEQMEDRRLHRRLSRDEQLRILTRLTDGEVFEQFIHKKFLGAKRFSLEGAETLIPLLDLAIEEAGEHGVEEIVIGMPHRGRLNVLANILGKSPEEIFREFDDRDARSYMGRGDVKYHLGYSNDFVTSSGNTIHMSLSFNPSHLEFVGPVVNGRVRAKQDRQRDAHRKRVMGVVIHGDAAFAGQGVVQELLNMSGLPGYSTGGTLHIIVNNQIGFTTSPEDSRSTQYATDVARMIQTPVFHVNGENPEAVAQVVRWALAYRARFEKDVIIDMYGYRRHGHNEGDEPAFTQPLLYKQIKARKSVREGYIDSLLPLGSVTREEADEIARRCQGKLDEELREARHEAYKPLAPDSGRGLWGPYRGGKDVDVPDVPTAVAKDRLSQLFERLCDVPDGFTPHPKIVKFLGQRREMARGERPLDWGAAEAVCFASLLAQRQQVRLSGQDSERGTFSHRHSVLHDVKTGAKYTPLAHVSDNQAPFQVWNSPLSEIGVLGFDYGYGLDCPDGLVMWEAQFGDFANVAQVIIDQFIISCEDKWHRLSGLTLLLPHGFEGQGPEHSSARLERFLALAAEDNIQVVSATTPAQLFHCLRRQVLRPLRKPLIMMSPKSLLRHPAVVSPLEDLADGRFRRVIADDGELDATKVRRVLLCSGKVYYDLDAARRERELDDVAIIRLEQLYPVGMVELADALARYAKDIPVTWVQEEPANMGAWSHLRLRWDTGVLGHRLGCVTRPASASPATGSASAHKHEQATLMDEALMGK